MIGQLTVRRIENCNGIVVADETADSSLGEWYQSVLDKPLGQFSDKDFGIACRQQLHTEFVVPVLLSRIAAESHNNGMPTQNILKDGGPIETDAD